MPVILLGGDNGIEIDDALREVRSRFGEADVATFDGAEVSLPDLASAALTAGLFEPERLIVVHNLHARLRGARKEGLAEIRDILAGVPPTTTLLLVSRDLPTDSPLVGVVRETGGEVRMLMSPRRNDVQRWIASRGRKLGVTIEPAAAEVLADLIGTNAAQLDSELIKLATYAGEEPITPRMVEELVGAVTQDSIFALVDAIGSGSRAQALRLLRAQTEGAATDPMDFALYLIRMLARQMRILLRIRLGQEMGRSTAQITADLKIPRYYADRYLRQARRLSTERLTAAFDLLATLELQLKRGETDPALGLDLLVTELAG